MKQHISAAEPLPYSEQIRHEFPLLCNHPRLHYLDSAATAHKPDGVVAAVTSGMTELYANPGRGSYPLAEQAGLILRQARVRTARELAVKPAEILFCCGTTDGLNMIAGRLYSSALLNGSRVVVTSWEHHSNYLPWQQLAEQQGLDFAVLPLDEQGAAEPGPLEQLSDGQTALFAVTAMSNVTGAQPDLPQLLSRFKEQGALTVVDAAQYAAHRPVDPAHWGCDFTVFSAHKCYGPAGLGILWGREELLEQLFSLRPGGGTVNGFDCGKPLWADLPGRHEGGTPDFPAVNAVAPMWDLLRRCYAADQAAQQLTALFADALQSCPGVRVLPGSGCNGIISFEVEGIHPHDVAHWLGIQNNTAVRAGQMCAAPLFEKLQIPAAVRVSLGVYNTAADLQPLLQGISALQRMMNGQEGVP